MTSGGGSCRALPAPTGRTTIVTPAEVAWLRSTLASAQTGDTIALADGRYVLNETLTVSTPGVTFRSLSGNRGAVILDGSYLLDDLIAIRASDVVVADLTLVRAKSRAVRVLPSGSSVYGTLVHNVRIVDSLVAAFSIEPFAGFYADNGVLECSSLELSDEGRTALGSHCEVGGVSADSAANWQVEVNAISGFWCPSGSARPAVRFAAGSRGTVVDRTTIVNSARGILLGSTGEPPDRMYTDDPCAGRTDVGHYGGAVLNNTVAASDARLFNSQDGFQSGITLERSCGTNVVHNTVASTEPPRASSIEWRYPSTVATVANNLVSHTLAGGNDAAATMGGNMSNAPLTIFAGAVERGDLHLTARAVGAIDTAATLSTAVGWDLDGEPRSSQPDVGADEFSGIRYFNTSSALRVAASPAITVAAAPATPPAPSPSSFTLSAPPGVARGAPLPVTWSADPARVTAGDWIGIFMVGTSDLVPLAKKFTRGVTEGTATITAPAAAGTYELRYFSGGVPTRLATSAAIAVTP